MTLKKNIWQPNEGGEREDRIPSFKIHFVRSYDDPPVLIPCLVMEEEKRETKLLESESEWESFPLARFSVSRWEKSQTASLSSFLSTTWIT